jgi:lipoyl(octanoyl) transferase
MSQLISSLIKIILVVKSLCVVINALQQQQLGLFQPIFSSSSSNIAGYSLSDLQRLRRIRLLNFVKAEGQRKTHDDISDQQQLLLSFRNAWDLQKRLVEYQMNRLQRQQKIGEENLSLQHEFESPSSRWLTLSSNVNEALDRGNDCILILQHEPVYTLGTGSDERFILEDYKSDKFPIDVVRIERGGEVTYHGPGQLVVYPILDLRGYKQDIHWYMRALEEAILLALHSVGVKGATREEAVTGVWVGKKKIAALGIKVRRWVTMHGLAVNVDKRSMENFNKIMPCGLSREVGCINDLVESPITVEEFSLHMIRALETVFHATLVESETGEVL